MREWIVIAASVLAGCSTTADEQVSETEAYSYSYSPMGFARVSAAGGLVTEYDSDGTVTSSRSATGVYTVSFGGLGGPWLSFPDAQGGNAQVTAEGGSNVRCRISGWSYPLFTGEATVGVRCTTPGGVLADTPFAVLFFRYTMPAPNPYPTNAAYAWVDADGSVAPFYDYNSSGAHNTVAHASTGRYRINIPNALSINASMMVTAHGGGDDTSATCSIEYWSTGIADVVCHDRAGALTNSAFAFSYSRSGPAIMQQSAHAWFDGASASPWYTDALDWSGPCDGRLPAVIGSRDGSLVTISVEGDIGSGDPAAPIRRASFASHYGGAGYCKVEWLGAWGGPWSSIAWTQIRCYSPTGAPIGVPRMTFTHVTSDAEAPC